MLKTWIPLAMISFLSLACASRGTVVVRTNPSDAKVYIVDTKTGDNSLMGQTPLTFSKKLAEEKDSEVFQLRIEKDGFESKYASVAAFGKETTYVDVKLSSVLSANGDIRKAFETNRQLMSEATRLAAGKRFSEALARIEKVIETDPKNDEAHAAKGSLMYLMKDYNGAHSAWKKALEINPSNDSVRASLVDLNLSLNSQQRNPADEEGQ